MAKRKGSLSYRKTIRVGRVPIANAKVVFAPTPAISVSPSNWMRWISDNRTYHPEGPHRRLLGTNSRPATTGALVDRNRNRYPANRFKVPSQTKALLAFSAPDKALVCVRRNIRKEVLHALNKTGKRGQKRPRRSWTSSYSC